jgi:hypothetical protein
MTYTKPKLNGYAAIISIQGSKSGQPFEMGSTVIHSVPAYEADE